MIYTDPNFKNSAKMNTRYIQIIKKMMN